jgi:hypothetical protein
MFTGKEGNKNTVTEMDGENKRLSRSISSENNREIRIFGARDEKKGRKGYI